MGLSLILPMANRAVLRARFFQSHGVTLESHARSRSGVREEDGMVVFAMPVERVRVDAWGCSFLLWTGCDRLRDDAISVETLHHCRLAVQHGVAEGFLLGRDHAPMECQGAARPQSRQGWPGILGKMGSRGARRASPRKGL